MAKVTVVNVTKDILPVDFKIIKYHQISQTNDT